MHAKSLQSCPTLCDPMDRSLPGSSVHGILQARILEWVAMPFSRGSSDPGIKPMSLMSPALAGGFFTTSTTWEAPILGHASHFICLTPGTTLCYPHQAVTLSLSSGINLLPPHPQPDSLVLIPLQLKQRGKLALPSFALS